MSIGMTGIVTKTETAATFDKPPAPCFGLIKKGNFTISGKWSDWMFHSLCSWIHMDDLVMVASQWSFHCCTLWNCSDAVDRWYGTRLYRCRRDQHTPVCCLCKLPAVDFVPMYRRTMFLVHTYSSSSSCSHRNSACTSPLCWNSLRCQCILAENSSPDRSYAL